MGGNDFTYDAANMYVTGAHLEGEEHHSIYALREHKKIAIEVFQNADCNNRWTYINSTG